MAYQPNEQGMKTEKLLRAPASRYMISRGATRIITAAIDNSKVKTNKSAYV